MKLTFEQVYESTKKALMEYAFFDNEIDRDKILAALRGDLDLKLSELSFDSLDIVEIIMYVEDELGVFVDDSNDEKYTPEIKFKDLPKLIYDNITDNV